MLLPLLENTVAENLRQQMGLRSAPEVKLRGAPGGGLLLGEFSGGRVVFEDMPLDAVRPDRVVVNLDPFEIDGPGSVAARSLVTEEPLSGRLRAELSPETLTKAVRSEAGGAPVEEVSLEGGQMVVSAELSVLGGSVPVSIGGEPVVRTRALVFEPEEARAAGVRLPDRLLRRFSGDAELAYPLKDLPEGVAITGAKVEDGRLLLTGRVEGMPVGGVSSTTG